MEKLRYREVAELAAIASRVVSQEAGRVVVFSTENVFRSQELRQKAIAARASEAEAQKAKAQFEVERRARREAKRLRYLSNREARRIENRTRRFQFGGRGKGKKAR